MFIERITQDDLKKFLNADTVHKPWKYNDDEIYVTYEYSGVCFDNTINNRYSDFDSSNGDGQKWRKFLYDKFGDEYLKCYKNYLEKQNIYLVKKLMS